MEPRADAADSTSPQEAGFDAHPTPILDDLPSEQDALDFKPYVATLADIIASPSTRTPLTIGVFGTWGSGKTSLMRMVRKHLPKGSRVAWFDAWKYAHEATLWRALLLQVLATLRAAVPEGDAKETQKALSELDDLQTALYHPVDREEVGRVTVDWTKMAKGSLMGMTHLTISLLPGLGPALSKMLEKAQQEISGADLAMVFDAIDRERSQIHIEQIQFLEQFQDRFGNLVHEHVVAKGRRLIVFVDDLDRCLPEKAVEVLEAIKLFLDVPGCVFVLGLDQAVIARGIEIKYHELGLLRDKSDDERGRLVMDGARYLEKIIQLPFQLPPIERSQMTAFVEELVDTWPDPECPRVFAEGLGDNPRQVKRTVNVFLLLWQLAQKRQVGLPVRLAKVVAIQHIYPELYDVLKTTPRLLGELEDYYRAETAVSLGSEGRAEGERLEPPPVLAHFIHRAAVRRLLTMHPVDRQEANFSGLSSQELGLYFTLTRRAEAPQVGAVEAARVLFEPQTVRVPAGPFLMGSTREQVERLMAAGLSEGAAQREFPQDRVELPDYSIGKYPVTNTEYQAFVRGTGHQPPGAWDDQSPPEGKGDHPVAGVTWHDAAAYCQWLSEKTGKAYRLPSEAEWEKAARGGLRIGGEDNPYPDRVYPWGDEWDETLCNSREGGPGDTTPVGQFSPGGDSPYGCVDMAGNVWEWTLSVYKGYPYDPEDGREDPEAGGDRALRGGSWVNNRWLTRVSFRDNGRPVDFDDNIGFRVSVAVELG